MIKPIICTILTIITCVVCLIDTFKKIKALPIVLASVSKKSDEKISANRTYTIARIKAFGSCSLGVIVTMALLWIRGFDRTSFTIVSIIAVILSVVLVVLLNIFYRRLEKKYEVKRLNTSSFPGGEGVLISVITIYPIYQVVLFFL